MSKDYSGKLKKDKKDKEKDGEKDSRMQQLEDEITRLESENELLRLDQEQYEDKFQRAVLRGVSTLNAEVFRVMKNPTESNGSESGATTSAEEEPEDTLTPETVECIRKQCKPARVKANKSANSTNKFRKRMMCSKTPSELCCKSSKNIPVKKEEVEVEAVTANHDGDRIQKLENEVARLQHELECMKKGKSDAQDAIQCAILRGVSALGGRYRVVTSCPQELGGIPEDDGMSCKSGATGTSIDGLSCCTSQARSVSFCEPKADQGASKKTGKDHCGEFTLG